MLHKKSANFYTDDTSTSFIYNDILQFSKNYDVVNVFTFSANNQSEFPENVRIIVVDYSHYAARKILKKYFFLTFQVLLIEFLSFPKYLFRVKYFRQAVNEWLRCLYLADYIKAYPISDVNLHFTFWFNNWATALAVLSKQGKIISFFARAHGSDLYEYRVPVIERLPFRWFQLKHVNKVFCVSISGRQYLKEKYKKYINKVESNYLGTKNNQKRNSLNDQTFCIVSCALINNIKRVELIPKVLSHLNFPITWYHIGEENLNDPILPVFYQNIEMLKTTNPNISIQLLGGMSNEAVFSFYENQSLNLFLSLSSTEGLPISICEAASFGIPLLATDVGGCREIVNKNTGILIENDFEEKQVANLINDFKHSNSNTEVFRRGVFEFWNLHFNREINFKRLLEEMQ
jgi:glycosyltransferase involved in cell wall biosynthesis